MYSHWHLLLFKGVSPLEISGVKLRNGLVRGHLRIIFLWNESWLCDAGLCLKCVAAVLIGPPVFMKGPPTGIRTSSQLRRGSLCDGVAEFYPFMFKGLIQTS